MHITLKSIISNREKIKPLQSDSQAIDAIAFMIEHKIKYLPVLQEDELLGIVTFESIINAIKNLKTSLEDLHIVNAIENTKTHNVEEDFFQLLGILQKYSIVALVEFDTKKQRTKYYDLLSIEDAFSFYEQKLSDLLKVESIEKIIKELILLAYSENKSNSPSLAEAIRKSLIRGSDRKKFLKALSRYESDAHKTKYIDENIANKHFNSIYNEEKPKDFHSLTLGEYINILLYKENKKFVETFFDAKISSIRNMLEGIREIRNHLAHFKGTLSNEQKEQLNFCRNLIYRKRAQLSDRGLDAIEQKSALIKKNLMGTRSHYKQEEISQRITSVDILTYLDSPLHLWAAKNRHLETRLSRYDRYLIKQAIEIESRAIKFLLNKYDNPNKFEVKTGVTFKDGPYLTRLDAMVYDLEADCYDIYEIRNSTRVTIHHKMSLVFQHLIASKEINVRNLYLINLNKEFIHDDNFDESSFFIFEKGNQWITEFEQEVLALREDALKVSISQTPSEFPPCFKPFSCPCQSLCHPNLPEYPIYNLPRLNKTRAEKLREMGIISIKDIPDDFSLSSSQSKYVYAIKTGKPFIDTAAISNELGKLQYPLYFLDYETYNPAQPMHLGYKPYQHMVFQYSLHVLNALGDPLEHFEFVVTNDEDPGLQVVAHLKQHIGEIGSVIVWNQAFEAGRNQEMASMYPKYSKMLLNVNERIYDLMLIFSNHHYVDPGFKGSASIKNVLPVMLDGFPNEYDKLPIPKGDEAMMAWVELISGNISKNNSTELTKNLLSYCELDTMAMVKIWELLYYSISSEIGDI